MKPVAAAETFAPRGRSATALLFQPRPARNSSYRVYLSSHSEDVPSVFVHRRALEQIGTGALDAHPNETIGVLLGRPCRDQLGTYAIVEVGLTAGPGEHEGTGGTVRISASGRSLLHRRAGHLHPTLEPVGWWHSHPHGPAWYSSVDLDEQATYPRPYHVGIVVAVGRRGRDRDGYGDDGPFGVYVGPQGVRLLPQEEDGEERTTAPYGALPPGEGRRDRDREPAPAAHGQLDAPVAPANLMTALLGGALLLAIAVTLWIGLGPGGGSSPSTRAEEGVGRAAPREQPGPLALPAWAGGPEGR